MSNLEVIESLCAQLRAALSIIEEQARIMASHDIEESRDIETCTYLEERREDALQGGREALQKAEAPMAPSQVVK